ncbi:hypothetical protein L1987_78523 [Smallanthus sonchifolius]|uniref:Uncharacterized protein n=1 Tax=Smallanthus sonchifolius TaxID=185202 RepID=A0ACB8ZCQ2_9ASTR|nr:hypothetical protein L1987_78523 [Smallanthus sonchifolius]
MAQSLATPVAPYVSLICNNFSSFKSNSASNSVILDFQSSQGKQHKRSSVSTMSILSRSAAYKNLQEKALKKDVENDEKENKININKIDYGKVVEKSNDDGVSEGFGVGSGMDLERNTYPLASFLSAPLLTNYNTTDPLTDPILWSSLVPSLRTRSSQPVEQDDEETLALHSELVEGHLDLYGAQPVEGPLAYGRFDVCLLSLKY